MIRVHASSRTIQLLIDLLVAGICFFLLFYCVIEFPIRIWDEAIYANNAIELWLNSEPFVMHNNGVPNSFNIKPPLVIWIQGLSISIFGINEFAIRLPSILATLGVLSMLFILCKGMTGNRNIARLAVLVLLLSPGFLREHVTRTGDLDAWLLFFSFLLCSATFALKQYPKLHKPLIWIGATSVFLGFMTKSVSIFLCLPALLPVLLVPNVSRRIFRDRTLYLAGLICVLLIISYWYLQNALHSGHFDLVFRTEIERAYRNVMSWHKRPWYFYLDMLWKMERFSWFLYIFPVTLYFSLTSKSGNWASLARYSFIFVLGYLLTISIPPNKLEWYDAPVYPFLAVISSIGLLEIHHRLLARWESFRVLFPALLICGFGYLFFKQMHNLEKEASRINHFEEEGHCLSILMQENRLPETAAVLMQTEHSAHYHQLNFYRKKAFFEKNRNMDLYPFISQLRSNDTVIACQQVKKDSLQMTFNFKSLEECGNCQLIILGESR